MKGPFETRAEALEVAAPAKKCGAGTLETDAEPTAHCLGAS